jgi:hypothetical protein
MLKIIRLEFGANLTRYHLGTGEKNRKMTRPNTTDKEGRRHNIGFAKWRVSCFYESLVQGSVFQLNICAKNLPLRKAEKRYLTKKL